MGTRTRTIVTMGGAAAVVAAIAVAALAATSSSAAPAAGLADTPGSGQSVIDWNRQLISILGTPNAQ
ncbi:MAG: hypothetical protein JWR58_1041, partial [Pseudonocardia sp.]|nr:hypothetical protein [Pseudonocardia sp.]